VRVLFVGDLVAGRPILAVIRECCSLAGVAIESDRHRQVAEESRVEVFSTREINSQAVLIRLRSLEIDLIVNFNSTTLFGEHLLKCPRIGAINFHPGLLPDYGGLNVHQWAILNGETNTGATIHVMTPRVDGGSILAQSRVAIGAAETGLLLFVKLLRSGATLMAEVLQDVANTGLELAKPQAQPHRYFYRRNDRPSGRIDFSRPVEEVSRFIRALSYRPLDSPLGVPYLAAPGGLLEISSISTEKATTDPTVQVGQIIHLEPKRLDIVCQDGVLIANAGYITNEVVDLGVAAQTLGLRVGSLV
jgi:UDP-4-amino-4-deoxy-L-arabinose formyltransferase / UDP-glucuronic acid dehydrogenase (UDP-4-keto-hexauronic acid decarboxylating)